MKCFFIRFIPIIVVFNCITIVCYKQDSLFISLGYRCQTATQMRINGLRHAAFPFDWIITSFDTMYNLIENDFEGYMQKENLIYQDGPYTDDHEHFITDHYEVTIDKKYNVLFRDDFRHDEHFNQDYTNMKAKMNRRITRFYQTIHSGKHIYFVRCMISKEQSEKLCNLFYKKFPKLSFTLLAIDHTDEIKTNWNIPNVINCYVDLPNPYCRNGNYAAWKKLFIRLGFPIILTEPSDGMAKRAIKELRTRSGTSDFSDIFYNNEYVTELFNSTRI